MNIVHAGDKRTVVTSTCVSAAVTSSTVSVNSSSVVSVVKTCNAQVQTCVSVPMNFALVGVPHGVRLVMEPLSQVDYSSYRYSPNHNGR